MNPTRSVLRPEIWAGLISVVLFAWFLSPSVALGQYGTGGGGRHASEGKGDSDSNTKSGYKPLPPPGTLLPHAGEYLASESNYFEIVYMPLQTRIYLYDRKFRPRSAQVVRARMTLQLPQENVARQIPFQFVPMPAQATEQDYVFAPFDIRPLQDKETSITFEFFSQANSATFTPHYPRFSIRPYVVRAALAAADQDAITRQDICPVTGAKLGSRGQVVKLYVAEFPLFVSGEDCIAAVKENPQKFLPRPMMPNPGQ
jgi:hypothetical protein